MSRACWGMAVGYLFTFGYLIWTEFYGLSFIELFGTKEAILAAARQTGGADRRGLGELKAYAAGAGGQRGRRSRTARCPGSAQLAS